MLRCYIVTHNIIFTLFCLFSALFKVLNIARVNRFDKIREFYSKNLQIRFTHIFQINLILRKQKDFFVFLFCYVFLSSFLSTFTCIHISGSITQKSFPIHFIFYMDFKKFEDKNLSSISGASLIFKNRSGSV